MTRDCPHCGDRLGVLDATSSEARIVGLVYLRVRCHSCNTSVEGVGRGERDATDELDNRIRIRKGTGVEQWRIRPNPIGRR